MGAVSESGFRSHEDGAQIGSVDFRNLHALISHQHHILSTGRGPATEESYQQD
jgi:hypothetical protein